MALAAGSFFCAGCNPLSVARCWLLVLALWVAGGDFTNFQIFVNKCFVINIIIANFANWSRMVLLLTSFAILKKRNYY